MMRPPVYDGKQNATRGSHEHGLVAIVKECKATGRPYTFTGGECVSHDECQAIAVDIGSDAARKRARQRMLTSMC